ncbi:MAG: hypothetical protein IH983_05890 [Planctomycetes bacterium]|nr:hypothetical protein [Planctomycetota bacterium]
MNANVELSIEPNCARCRDLLASEPSGHWHGRSLQEWRRTTRGELGLAADRPIVATGHQTMLWHPGILAKYLMVEALAAGGDRLGTANLIVDQHTQAFDRFDVPLRRTDGSLAVHTITLTPRREEVPMGRHPAFAPPAVPMDLPLALPLVQSGIERIFAAVAAHRHAGNAALQMAAALADLMSRWVSPTINVTSTGLMNTSLARGMLEQMADDPRACAQRYNDAVRAVPEGGVGPLAITRDTVELPLWRIGPDDRRRRAYDGDVRRWLSHGAADVVLLPRALLLTAIVRVGMCDLFVHGTGGATYDRAMELWVRDWLGVEPCPIAVATATLRLPLAAHEDDRLDLSSAVHAQRWLWHDPDRSAGAARPGPTKQRWLEQINAAPRRSRQRRVLFGKMHAQLAELRRGRGDAIQAARQRTQRAARLAADAPIINRRTWAFPLYPDEMIEALADAVANAAMPGPAKDTRPAATAGPPRRSQATVTAAPASDSGCGSGSQESAPPRGAVEQSPPAPEPRTGCYSFGRGRTEGPH